MRILMVNIIKNKYVIHEYHKNTDILEVILLIDIIFYYIYIFKNVILRIHILKHILMLEILFYKHRCSEFMVIYNK